VLDTAKALSGMLGVEEPVERFLEGVGGSLEIPGPGVPWIAVPTTAGTGAEVTRNAVLRLTDRGLKRSMRSSFLLAASVIVDPELTVTLPPEVTGTGGLDALTQLVEAHVARKANSFTSSLVRGAFLPLRSHHQDPLADRAQAIDDPLKQWPTPHHLLELVLSQARPLATRQHNRCHQVICQVSHRLICAATSL
jgi:alcohol dehydrogenase